jgi:hypothetical protein
MYLQNRGVSYRQQVSTFVETIIMWIT